MFTESPGMKSENRYTTARSVFTECSVWVEQQFIGTNLQYPFEIIYCTEARFEESLGYEWLGFFWWAGLWECGGMQVFTISIWLQCNNHNRLLKCQTCSQLFGLVVSSLHSCQNLQRGKNDMCVHSTGQQQGQEGVKVQPGPVTVTVGNLTNASLNAVSPDQLGQAQSPSEQEGQPSKRLRRVACSCPNCRDGEGRWEPHSQPH